MLEALRIDVGDCAHDERCDQRHPATASVIRVRALDVSAIIE